MSVRRQISYSKNQLSSPLSTASFECNTQRQKRHIAPPVSLHYHRNPLLIFIHSKKSHIHVHRVRPSFSTNLQWPAYLQLTSCVPLEFMSRATISPYRPNTSAKIRIKIMPTKSLGCWAVPRTPASPTIPIAKLCIKFSLFSCTDYLRGETRPGGEICTPSSKTSQADTKTGA